MEARPIPPTPIPNLPPELAKNEQYEILRELGRGGMGVVYLAKNKIMDRIEVLKVVNKALLDRPGSIERFLREIRSAAQLHHTNVVTAYSVLQLGDSLAFAMEYVEGEDLAKLVKAKGPLPVPAACACLQQAALGLQHAFEKNMVHRDIKPHNLMLAREGKKSVVKILDFGLAKATREKGESTELTGEGAMLGTPDFVAPEQALDAANADIRADIYSLGCTLYYLLTGRGPFHGKSLGAILMAHQTMDAKPLNLVRPEVPEELAAVVRKMMAKDPAKRYQTPLEVAQALAVFIKPGGKIAPKSSPELSQGTAGTEPASAKRAAPERRVEPAAEAPQPRSVTMAAASPVAWDTLTDGGITSIGARKSGAIRKKPHAAAQPAAKKKWLIGSGIGVGVLLLALIGMWASGAFKVKVKTADGKAFILLEIDQPGAEVEVNGEKINVKVPGDNQPIEIKVEPGQHKLRISKRGFVAVTKEIELTAGKSPPIKVKLIPVTDEGAKAELPEKEKPPTNARSSKPEKAKPEPSKTETTKPIVAAAAAESEYVPAFNGKDLTGWEIVGKGEWKTENGMLRAEGQGQGWLATQRDYEDFELELEYRLGPKGNSGVFIHAWKEGNHSGGEFLEIQLADDQGHNTVGKVNGTAAIHGVVASNPTVQSAPYVWHKLYIRAKGRRLQVSFDTRQVLDVNLDDYADFFAKKTGLKRTIGRIGLQHWGTSVDFRNIRVKDLSASAADGFRPLFNGKDLTGWSVDGGPPGQWVVEGNTIVGQSKHCSTRNYLLTEKDYADFVLRFDFKVQDGSHGGVAIRAIEGEKMPGDNTSWFDHPIIKLTMPGMKNGEMTGTNHWLKSAALHERPVEDLSLPTGVWHSMEVVVRGDNCKATVNGKKLVDVTLDPDARHNGIFVPGLGRQKGKVGF